MRIMLAMDKFKIAMLADGIKEKTVNWYIWLLSESPANVLVWLSRHGVHELSEVKTDDLREYIVELRTTPNVRTGAPLTVSGLAQILKRIGKRAGVRGRVNPHAFRHAFGRAFITSGGDSTTLAKIMGHEDINTTKIYARFTQDDQLAKVYDQYAPRKRIGK